MMNNVEMCEVCNDEPALYYVNGEAMCRECAEELLDSIYNDLLITEKADALNIDFFHI